MKIRKTSDGAKSTVKSAPEIRLRARAVSRGVSIGHIVCLHGTTRQFFRIDLDQKQIPAELKRLRSAVSVARKQLDKLVHRRAGRIADSGPGIFESHRMLIEDSSLLSKFEAEVVKQKVNAEWAIKHVTDIYVGKYKAIEDEHLRDRYIDVEDVADRILVALGGASNQSLPFAKDSIIASKELRPSTLIELAEEAPRAIITENGGWTSHTFILAREMNWPGVTGIKKILRRVKDGDSVIVDGYNGVVILHPTKETLDQYAAAAERFHETIPATAANSGPSIKTLDGHEVKLFANADTPRGYRRASSLGASGVGLYRSEFLFNRLRGFPTEAEQVRAYTEIADAAGEAGVKIRTFDIGADQLVDQNAAKEKNPALGLRAIRLGLGYKKFLRTQLRAILRASYGRRIDIVVPMVSGVSEVREVRELIREESAHLKTKGKKAGLPKLGVMIEVPSAVMMIDDLVSETDFVCLGTNDLIQYLLAVDRDNEAVAGWYRTLHPAVLKAIRTVLEASAKIGKPAVICGEMAGSPYYVPVLIGMGASELSMNVSSISRVRNIISGIAADEAREMVRIIQSAVSVEDVEDSVNKLIRKNWKHLFPPDFSFTS